MTFLATFFGLHGQQNNPSGTLMPGKVIGCGWTNVLTWLRWELNTSLMPFASTHKGPGTAAIQALGIPSCRVLKDAYLENMHVNTFLLTPRRIQVERKASAAFFLSGCCMAQRRSLSGRSPFCQRTQRIKSQCHFRNYHIFVKATIVKKAKYKTPTSLQSPRECRGGSDVAKNLNPLGSN